jgi:hypothetical protein
MATDADSPKIPLPVADAPSPPGAPGAVNPAALTVEQLARLLTAAGAKSAADDAIRRHIARGAPAGADGRMNLMHYMAWLIRELSRDAADAGEK